MPRTRSHAAPLSLFLMTSNIALPHCPAGSVSEVGRRGAVCTKSLPLECGLNDSKLLAKKLATQRGEIVLKLSFQHFVRTAE